MYAKCSADYDGTVKNKLHFAIPKVITVEM